MEIQENNTSLETLIHEKYPFLNETEIKDFLECHPWLSDEKDPSILEEYLKEYFQGLAVRYNSIVDTFNKLKSGPQTEKSKAEDNKKEQEPVEANAHDNNETGDHFEQFLTSIQELHQDLFELKGQREQFLKIVRFLETLLDNLIKNSKDPAHRQVELIDPQLKEDNLIVILNSLGYDITLFTENEILFILNTDPSQDFLSIASDTIKTLYTHNPQFMEEVNSDPSVRQRLEAQRNAIAERENDRAGFLASIHEQRVQQKTNTSTMNRIGGQGQNQDQIRNQIYNTNQYLPDPSNVRNQIEDYRARMRNRFMEGRSFSGGNNMMTLTDMNNRERQSDQVPRASNSGFGSRIVTASDIEKKRVEEDKVKFGVRALELTNQFRKSNGLPPLVWSQELCDVGMEHSKDMAEGRVPFGHHGFNNRCKKVKFYHRSMAENVAYNTGYSDPPKAAVEGWIASPGHRKNMLSNSNVCAISCYRAPNGSWYFTQLFALRT